MPTMMKRSRLSDLPADVQAQVREEIATAANKGDYLALAALVNQFVELEIPHRDITPLVLGTGDYNYGDVVTWTLTEGTRAYVLTEGAKPVKTEISMGKIVPEPIMLHSYPTAFLPDLRAGNIQPLINVEAAVANAMVKQKNYYTWSLLTAAVAAGDDNYAAVAGSDITASALQDAIAYVQDAAGSAVAVIGRATSVNPITAFTGYDDITIREILMTGTMGVYYGANIIGIQQIKDEYGLRGKGTTNLIDTDVLMVVGGQSGVVQDSALEMEEQGVDERLYVGWHYYKWMIGSILFPERLYKIKMTG